MCPLNRAQIMALGTTGIKVNGHWSITIEHDVGWVGVVINDPPRMKMSYATFNAVYPIIHDFSWNFAPLPSSKEKILLLYFLGFTLTINFWSYFVKQRPVNVQACSRDTGRCLDEDACSGADKLSLPPALGL